MVQRALRRSGARGTRVVVCARRCFVTPPLSTIPGGCPECGATVGHRAVLVEETGEDGITRPKCRTTRTCSLGMDVVPRAEHEETKRVLLEWAQRATTAEGQRDEAIRQGDAYVAQIIHDRESQERFQDGRDKYWLKKLRTYRDIVRECQRETEAMLVNLTSTQARCTELLEEVRALRVERDEAERRTAALLTTTPARAGDLHEDLP